MNIADSIVPERHRPDRRQVHALGQPVPAEQPQPEERRLEEERRRIPSIASGAPNTPPTKREYVDQFIPNWNSCTSPVTTPIATLISSSVPKKRVIRL